MLLLPIVTVALPEESAVLSALASSICIFDTPASADWDSSVSLTDSSASLSAAVSSCLVSAVVVVVASASELSAAVVVTVVVVSEEVSLLSVLPQAARESMDTTAIAMIKFFELFFIKSASFKVLNLLYCADLKGTLS